MKIVLFVDGQDSGLLSHILHDHFDHQVEVRSADEILGEFHGSVAFTPDLFILDANTMNTLTHLQMVRVLTRTGIPVVVIISGLTFNSTSTPGPVKLCRVPILQG